MDWGACALLMDEHGSGFQREQSKAPQLYPALGVLVTGLHGSAWRPDPRQPRSQAVARLTSRWIPPARQWHNISRQTICTRVVEPSGAVSRSLVGQSRLMDETPLQRGCMEARLFPAGSSPSDRCVARRSVCRISTGIEWSRRGPSANVPQGFNSYRTTAKGENPATPVRLVHRSSRRRS